MSHSLTREKIRQKVLSPWKQLLPEMFHSINVLGAKEIILSFTKILSKNFVEPYNLFPDIFYVRYYKKKQAISFSSLESLPFFSKVCLLNNLLVLPEWSYYFHSNCRNTFCTLTNCCLRFVTLCNKRLNKPNSFLLWKDCLFRKVEFSTTSQILEK